MQLQIIAKKGTPSDRYQEHRKSSLRRGRDLFFTNFRFRTPAHRQVALLKNCVYRGQRGDIIYRETGLKVIVITTIRETVNRVCCNFNEEWVGWVKRLRE